MNAGGGGTLSPWQQAALVVALFAVDPVGTGGVALRANVGPVRERWLAMLSELLPAGTPLRRIPIQISDDRLLGGLDLTATLRAGRPIAEPGLLLQLDGGVALLPMAERLSAATAARLTVTLDARAVTLERDGLALRGAARFGVVALDEGILEDERPPPALLDRLAFRLDLASIGRQDVDDVPYQAREIVAARQRLSRINGDAEEEIEALCSTAMALGIASLRAPMLALTVARAAAALDGREMIREDDLGLAARLVLAPRAISLAATAPAASPGAESPAPDGSESSPESDGDLEANVDRPLEDRVLAAAKAAIPVDLLATTRMGGGARLRAGSQGSSGQLQQSTLRGRPLGARRGEPRAGARINVVETLRAAAPWQPLRRRDAGLFRGQRRASPRIEIRSEDFRVTRYRQRTQTTAIFVVDASGSSALHRLAEAKGAVELLLADCYVRRDQVALIAFRGSSAEIMLPPTRSLVRAKRSLADLPGGGGTPLAAGIDAAVALAEAVRRRGETPMVILLTDGRANVARDPAKGREAAEAEALAAARRMRAADVTALVVDTAPRPQPKAERLATEMQARYLPLPYADARRLSEVIRSATTD